MRVIKLWLRMLGTALTVYGVLELWVSRTHWARGFDDALQHDFAFGCLFFLAGLWLVGSVRH